MQKVRMSDKALEKFNVMLSRDEAGHLLKKAIRNVSAKQSDEEESTSKIYNKYAQELEDYGAPVEIVKAFRQMAADESQHHFIFNRLFYGMK